MRVCQRISFFCLLVIGAALARFRLGFGSCHSNEYPTRRHSIWKPLQQQQLNALILLGDNFYADTKSSFGFLPAQPESLKHQYDLLANNSDWVSLTTSLGWSNVFATWDDHDYGLNNADSSYPHKQYSSELFKSFFHVTSPQRDGIYHFRTLIVDNLCVKVIMLDTRYFKEPSGTPGRDILGSTQWVWLEEQLRDPIADIIFLASSIQVLPTQKIVEETWSDFPSSRARLLKMIDSSPCPNIVILSGDVHHAEISQAICQNRRIVELTSSGLSHSFSYVLSDNGPVIRSSLLDHFFSLYHAMYPAKHREHKYADMYRGIHFGLIDVANDSLFFRVLNHEGDTVMTKTVPLQKSITLVDHAECLPINGKETMAGKLLFTFGVMVPVFAFIIAPLAVVCWFVFACGMYVWFILEYRRRERLEGLQHLKRE